MENGKIKILLIEDDEILARVMYAELTEAGFMVIQTFDGEAGLLSSKSEKPDVIFLDLLLPKKSGFDVLKEFKKNPETKNIPVIIISMLGSDDDIKKGLDLGAIDYIVKSQHTLAEIVKKTKSFFGSNKEIKTKEPNF